MFLRLRRGLLLTSLILYLFPLAPAWADSSYVVQAGDTLTRIAARFGVSVQAIVAANGLPDANQIRIGQVLVIPDGAPVASAATDSPGSYIVQPGDSLSRLSARFGLSIQALVQANQLTSTTLQIGQVLIIPGAAPPASIYERVTGSAAFVQRVHAALDWLKAEDAAAFHQVEAYVTTVTASPYRSRATARSTAAGCAVRALARPDMSTPLVAALLVHEATHCLQFTAAAQLAVQPAEVEAYTVQLEFMQRHGFPAEEIAYYQAVLDYYAGQPPDARIIPPPTF